MTKGSKSPITIPTAIGIGILIVFFVFSIVFVAYDSQPQNLSSHADGNANAACQYYIKAGGSYKMGDTDPCVNMLKTLIDAAHTYDVSNSAGLWITPWTEPFKDPAYGPNVKNAAEGFQATTQTTVMIRALSWSWPVQDLDVDGVVNLNTFSDLCAQDVAIGVPGAESDCSTINTVIPTTQPASPTCTLRPICQTGQECPMYILPGGNWCPLTPSPVLNPTCTPRPVCAHPGFCMQPQIMPRGGWCPQTSIQPVINSANGSAE